MNKNSLNSKETVLLHKSLIENKPILKKIYEKYYKNFKNAKVPDGMILELGSGGGFIKKIIPKVVTSDVIDGPGIDKVFFAEKMPFRNSSLSAIYMLNVLHHIKNPEKALREMQRCLKDHGKIVMIEPYNSIWSNFIYSNFHHELFDSNSDWKVRGKGRLSDANGAIPWIIFVRDRKLFERKFPKLKIKKISPHTPFSYLLFGNLSKPQYLPSFLYKYVSDFEDMISPLNKYIGLFVTIELEKII